MTEQPNPYAAPTSVSAPAVISPADLFAPLQTAAMGLTFMYAGILVVLLAGIAMIPVSIFAEGGPWSVTIFFAAGGMVGAVLISAGPLFCLTVPRGIGLRPFAIVAVCLQVLTIASILFTFFTPGLVTVLLFGGTMILLVATASAFLLFLYRLCECIGRRDLRRRARNVGVFGAMLLFGLFPISAMAETYNSTGAALIVTLGFTFAAVILFVAYANVIHAIGTAIRKPGNKKPPVGIA